MRSTTFLTLSFAPMVALAETGPWFNYCGSNSLDNAALVASCSGGQTSIDLNQGIGNSNGQLVWQANGGYFGSCAKNGGNCDLQFDILICDCKNTSGDNKQSSLSLSEHLDYNTDTNTLSFTGL
ncbi:hypothetical protein E8E14_001198 [Neopestalotiopsis sp. 37M]|nr:hypothetical protein E8E14_001198 [Neopestalotiopsis sp. 37M]